MTITVASLIFIRVWFTIIYYDVLPANICTSQRGTNVSVDMVTICTCSSLITETSMTSSHTLIPYLRYLLHSVRPVLSLYISIDWPLMSNDPTISIPLSLFLASVLVKQSITKIHLQNHNKTNRCSGLYVFAIEYIVPQWACITINSICCKNGSL